MMHKMYKILILSGLVALLGVLLSALIWVISAIASCYGEFEYTTMNGEKGTAISCMVSYGSAHCRTDNGTELIVESFRKVK